MLKKLSKPWNALGKIFLQKTEDWKEGGEGECFVEELACLPSEVRVSGLESVKAVERGSRAFHDERSLENRRKRPPSGKRGIDAHCPPSNICLQGSENIASYNFMCWALL